MTGTPDPAAAARGEELARVGGLVRGSSGGSSRFCLVLSLNSALLLHAVMPYTEKGEMPSIETLQADVGSAQKLIGTGNKV